MPDDYLGVLRRDLTAAGFTIEQARKAELWITRGDWVYRGKDARLEFSDFYPTEKQWRVDDDLVVMTTAEREQLCRRHYGRGYQDRRQEDIESRSQPLSGETAELVRGTIEELRREAASESVPTVRGGEGEAIWQARIDDERLKRVDAERMRLELAHRASQWQSLYHDLEESATGAIVRLLTDDDYYRSERAKYEVYRAGGSARLYAISAAKNKGQ